MMSSCLLCTTEWLDIRGALLLFSRLNQPSTLCLPSYAQCSSPSHCKDIMCSPGRTPIFLLLSYIQCFSLLSRSLWITKRQHPGKGAKQWRTAISYQGDHKSSMNLRASKWVWAEDSWLWCEFIENKSHFCGGVIFIPQSPQKKFSLWRH